MSNNNLYYIFIFLVYLHKKYVLGPENIWQYIHIQNTMWFKVCHLKCLKSIRWYNKRPAFEVNNYIIYKYIHNMWHALVGSGFSPGGALLSGASGGPARYCCCHDNHSLVEMASLLKEPLFEISAQGPAPNKDFYQLSITKSEVSYLLSCTT